MSFVGPVTLIYRFFKNQKAQREGAQDEKVPKSSAKRCPHRHAEGHELTESFDATKPNAIDNASSLNGACSACKTRKKAERYYRLKVIGGLILPFTLTSLDTTIIAGALPFIASDFHQLSQMNWIVSAFNLTSAAFIPFWGQIADIFGRHTAVQTCLFLMLIGSAICTGAPTDTFPVLLLGRALQGIASAGIVVITKVILADKVSLEENAKNTSVFSICAGVGYGVGPVIGGYFTSANWRWCFGINLPIAFVGMILIFFVLRPELLGPRPIHNKAQPTPAANDLVQEVTTLKAKILTIDFGGQALFLSGTILITLALTWGGSSYVWSSANVLAPLVIGIFLIITFVAWEYLMVPGRLIARKLPQQRPTIPWTLMAQRNMGLLFCVNFATGMAMIAVLYFVDFYFTLVKGFTASKAGTQLLYYTPGLGAGVYLAIFMCNQFPRKTFPPLMLGSVIEAVGITVLAWALSQGHSATIYGLMALTGVGTGLRFMPGSLHAIGFFPNNIASVISMMAFAVPFGGTVGMTVMNSVFNNKSGLGSGGSIATYTTNQQVDLEKVKMAIVWSFVALVPFMWLCVLAAAGLGNVDITGLNLAGGEGGPLDFSESVDEGPVLLTWLKRGRSGSRRVKSQASEVIQTTTV
ncbi:MFS general substrate transporter-15 [Coleophoma crateriformis]|uniref:MFS general substrate transporter-15 n=1 Tax=Coleophoma crateriformis TaxID=565419 RepID=A0A3D8S9M3_9HELO|nr:MFS general substrate transporter-15 [Coleophoma crateriformis]